MANNSPRNHSYSNLNRILAVLMLVSIVISAVYLIEGSSGPFHRLQLTFNDANAPFMTAASSVKHQVEDYKIGISDQNANPQTLSELTQQNKVLKQDVAILGEYKAEAERLENLLGMASLYNFDYIPAKSISTGYTIGSSEVVIDVGSSSGVVSGQAVVGEYGLVGQIVGVGEFTSTVRLITDAQSAISARIQSTNTQGFVRGSTAGTLTLANVPMEQTVVPGELVVSSGIGGTVPAGLLIGSVDLVREDNGGTTRDIFISPNQGTIGSLQNLLVVTSLTSEPSQFDLYESAIPRSSQDKQPASDAQSGDSTVSGDAESNVTKPSESEESQ